MTTYGPYKRKDGRSHVIHYDNGERVTQSYPRYLMEQHLGRKLRSEEVVDHINNNPEDNRIENFQLLSTAQNNKKDRSPAETQKFICPTCNNDFYILSRQYRGNQIKQGKKGPYCSKSCAGKAHH